MSEQIFLSRFDNDGFVFFDKLPKNWIPKIIGWLEKNHAYSKSDVLMDFEDFTYWYNHVLMKRPV